MATRSRYRGRGKCSTPTRSLIPGFAVRDGGEPQLRSGLRRTTEAGEGMTEKQFENAEGDAENRQQDRLGLTKAGTVPAIRPQFVDFSFSSGALPAHNAGGRVCIYP